MNTAINIQQFKSAGNQKSHKPSMLTVLTTKVKASRAAKKVVKSLKEVRDFESGKKQPKSFDDFLKEL